MKQFGTSPPFYENPLSEQFFHDPTLCPNFKNEILPNFSGGRNNAPPLFLAILKKMTLPPPPLSPLPPPSRRGSGGGGFKLWLLQLRVFQLAGNCKTYLRAPASFKRHAENHLGSEKALERVYIFLQAASL